MTLRTALLGTAFAVAFGGAAEAARINGWYLSLEGGANWIEDWNHSFFTTPAQAGLDTGWTVLAAVGHGWNGWRFEFEAGYRDNDVDTYTIGGGPATPTAAEVWEASLMANVLYDLELTERLSLSLGAGVGADYADVDITFGALTVDDDDWNFAYQGIVGINYAVGRQTQLFVTYRYFRVNDPEFDFRPTVPVFLTNGDDAVKHTATIGLRYALSAPAVMSDIAPPPAPAEPVATSVPRQFIVFFGFNKYNLTSEALRVISEAVVAAKDTGSATVLITGHTDTVGSNAYNLRLSLRRSNTVKAEMVRQGIPTSAITSTGKGETELLVQTADGVKEPQNRRATIDLN
jgi:outer membrane protein OmpA-like peptidoglycan-associated protein